MLDSKPDGPPSYGASSATIWVPSSQDSNQTARLGIVQFTAANGSQISLPTAGTTNFDSPQGTIMFWMRSAGTVTHSALQGITLFDRFAGSYVNGSGLELAQAESGTTAGGSIQIYWPAASVSPFVSHRTVSDNEWHHIALAYDQASNGPVALYIDGALDIAAQNLWAWTWPFGQQIELGRSHDGQWAPYEGLLDDFRIYARQLTQAEIAEVAGTDSLVDTNALQVRWNFDQPAVPGINVTWPSDTTILQSGIMPTGVYTDLPFAAAPYYLEPQNRAVFYRVRRASSVVIITNPYDM